MITTEKIKRDRAIELIRRGRHLKGNFTFS